MSAISRRFFVGVGVAAVFFGLAGPAPAQPRRRLRRLRRRAIRRFRRRHGPQQLERAREAVASGEVRPLREVLAHVQRTSDAEVLDVDLEEGPRGWVYGLRVLTFNGRVRDVFLDARTLELISTDEPIDVDGPPRRPSYDDRPPPRDGPPLWDAPPPVRK